MCALELERSGSDGVDSVNLHVMLKFLGRMWLRCWIWLQFSMSSEGASDASKRFN